MPPPFYECSRGDASQRASRAWLLAELAICNGNANMVSISSYLNLAELSYERADEPASINGFVVRRREFATALGNGFQGTVHEGDHEVIIAFAGTLGGLRSAPVSQTSANLRIGVNIIPNMAGSAKGLVKAAAEPAKPMSIVGHSLGGALAQVVGVWMSVPFISFNGPGMAAHLRMSAYNLFHPRQMRRTLKAAPLVHANGICFSVTDDFVGNFGSHVGVFEPVPWVGGAGGPHDLEAIRSGLGELTAREPSYWSGGFYHRRASASPPQLSLDLGPPLSQMMGRFM
jgi:hypothetical protein